MFGKPPVMWLPKTQKGRAKFLLAACQPEPAVNTYGPTAHIAWSGEAFEASQKYLRWQDRAANQKFFAGEHAAFSKEAADLLMEAGIIKQMPDMTKLADTQFIK